MTEPISGALGLMGSGEFEVWAEAAERELLSRASGDGSVAIVPLASALEGETYADWAHKGLEHYASLGVPARVVEVKERSDALDPFLAGQLERPSMIFLSGGNPAFLSDAIAGSPFGEALTLALGRGASLVGCSAGACLLGEVAPESVTENVDERLWVQGLRLVPNAWIFPHWDALDDHRPGLRDHFRERVPPEGVTIGVDERTILVGRSDDWVVFGEGRVTIGWRGAERVYRGGQTLSLRRATSDSQPAAEVAAALPSVPSGAGAIGLLSGDEFEPEAAAFDTMLLEAAGPRVGVLLAAGPGEADRQWAKAAGHYRALGADPVLVPVLERAEATPDRMPAGLDVLFLGGGDPAHLLRVLSGTPLWSDALDRWREGFVLAGSSAGAMALCVDCLVPRPGAELPTDWRRGLGPVEGVALAVHASGRPAEWLREITRTAPCPVVAMNECAGLLLGGGRSPRAVPPDGIRLA